MRNASAVALVAATLCSMSALRTSAQGGLIVTVTSPTAGSTVGGTIPVNASISPLGALTMGVQFKLDGVNLGAEDTSAPYSVSWNTKTASNGSHTLTAVARDALGVRWSSNPVTVTVFNDITPPAVSVTAPAAGATVFGPITVTASATDNVGVAGVQFRLDGVNLGAEDTTAPYSVSWNTTTAADGPHTLTAVARDAAANVTTSVGVGLTVDNGFPTVAMTAPASGSTVRASISVSANASDLVGVAGVQFRLDGANLGAEDTTAPYSVSWNTTTASAGSHTLTAIARDAAGHATTAASVTVTVDNIAPSASITGPASGATVLGPISVTANASDNIAVAGVQFRLDGVNLGAEDTTAPYSVSWNTTTTADGSHTLTAVARDTAGNATTSAGVGVTVDNGFPTVAMTAPAPGTTVSGSISVSANASDLVGVVGVQFRLDGVNLGAEDTTAPYSVSWNTTAASNGSHSLTAIARDAAAHTTTAASITVTVLNDSTPPTVGLTAPASGATVVGAIMVTANASDNIGVAGVQFKLDGANLGAEDTTAPYSVSWQTTTAADGSHTLTAVARDAAANVKTSAALAVTVDNGFPTVAMTAPASGTTVSGSISVSANASDLVGVAGVQFRLDGVNLGAEDTAAPYSVSWNTADASEGSHTLTAIARDAAGHATTAASVTVTVVNDITPPAVSVTAPASGATVLGPITVTASASDNVGVAGVQFKLDGVNLGAEDTTAPYSVSWNTTTAGDGDHTLTAVARDAASNVTTSAPVAVTVDNGFPTVAMTAPASGSTVSGSINVSANASDLEGVVGVQFRLDGVNLGVEDATAPYSVSWDTTGASESSHTLTAIARDAAGHATTAAAVTVTVDNVAPSVSMTAPASGSTVSGSINVTANASDLVGVAGVQFRLDGVNLGVEDTTAPYSVSWNTTTASAGSHTLTAIARDAAGHATTAASVTVTVDNIAPSASITAPASGATVAGSINVTANASDNVGVAGVQFKLDGVNLGAEDTTAPYSVSWDTTTTGDGPHTLTAVARDAVGNVTTSAAIPVTVDGGFPTVAMTAPASGATVSGTIAVGANASDLQGVAGVQFTLDGANLGAEDTTAPYSVSWNTTTASGGSHTLTAIARDAAGHASTAAAVTVTVDNVVPTVTMSAPASGAHVSGTINVTANASDNIGVAGVQFRLDGANLGAEDATAPYSVSWNTTIASEGSHTLTAIARDAAGQTTTASSVTVTVDNIAPTVSMTAPASGATVSGATGVSASANDNVGVVGVQFRLDGANLGAEDTTAPHSVSWDTATASEGSHTLTAIARDAAGQSTTAASVTVTVDNGFPTVAMTAPAPGATVSGSIIVSADASDAVGVAGVQFRLNGANLGAEDTTAPYSVLWDTTTVTNGSQTLTAIARDAAGHTTTAVAVTVTVNNGGGPAVTRFEETAAAVTWSGSWIQGNTSRPWSGGTSALGFAVPQTATFSFNGTAVSWIGFRGAQTGIAKVYLDGALVATVDPYQAAEELQAALYTSGALAQGPHSLMIEHTGTKNPAASDTFVGVDAFDVTNAANPTPPTVSINSPSEGVTVSGIQSVTAIASDNEGVAGVRFFVDGVAIGAEDTAPPYAVSWDTTTTTNGSHALTAVARDIVGNTATSAAVNILVSNADPTTPRSTRIEDTSPSIIYTPGTPGPGQPPAWFHGSRSRAWSDVTAAFNRSAGARATFAFTGTRVSWISFRAEWAGMARVYLDGVFMAEIDLFLTPEQVQVPVYTAMGLANGPHTLVVEVTGMKNPSATDNAVVVDAFDVAPAFPVPPEGTRFEETSGSMTFTGAWTQGEATSPWSGGTAAYATTAGAQATFNFTGTEVRWVGFRGPQAGIARIFLDGAFHAEVDTYSSREIQAVVFEATTLAPGAHTLRIEATGLKNAAATSSVIFVDALDVRTRFEERDASVAYTGTWLMEHMDKAWSGTTANAGSGTASRSATAGATATFTVKGTEVRWIGYRGPTAGIADVYLDGVFAVRLDLYAPTEELRVPVYTATGLAPVPHTVRIDVTGLKNPASTNAFVFVDAFDATLAAPTPQVSRFQQTDASVVYTSGWTESSPNSLYSGRTISVSNTTLSQATFTFTGSAVRWIGQRRREAGIARVYLDGALVGEVDLYSPIQDELQAPVFSVTGLIPGQHTLMIEVTGTKRGGPACTPGPEPPCSEGYLVVIDAFEVYQ